MLTLWFLLFSQCAFCTAPLPLPVLGLRTAREGAASAIPSLFTNFHCCESDLELKNGFTLTESAAPPLSGGRRWPGPYLESAAAPRRGRREGGPGLAAPWGVGAGSGSVQP